MGIRMKVEHLVWKLLLSLLPVLSPGSAGQLVCHATALTLQLCLLMSCRELSRYDRESAFPEKREYRPNVKIEYVDDDGRILSTKEVRVRTCAGTSVVLVNYVF